MNNVLNVEFETHPGDEVRPASKFFRSLLTYNCRDSFYLS